MWLHDCSRHEALILTAMAALGAELPLPWEEYTEALLEINRKYFGSKLTASGDHDPAGRSVSRKHEIRASKKWDLL